MTHIIKHKAKQKKIQKQQHSLVVLDPGRTCRAPWQDVLRSKTWLMICVSGQFLIKKMVGTVCAKSLLGRKHGRHSVCQDSSYIRIKVILV
jgi:hypothetical protein